MHVRQAILEAVAAAVTGLTTTETRVFVGRARALAASELPGLVLRSGNETPGPDPAELNAPRILSRALTVKVIACVRGDEEDLDAALNTIFEEVEPVLAMPIDLGGAQLVTLRGIGEPQVDSTSLEVPVGQATMFYEVVYLTQENAPSLAL